MSFRVFTCREELEKVMVETDTTMMTVSPGPGAAVGTTQSP